VIGLLVVASGSAGIACSAMIYQDTRRKFWSAARTFLKFFGTAALLGPATILFTMTAQAFWFTHAQGDPVFREIIFSLVLTLLIAGAAKLAWEFSVFFHLHDRELTLMKRTALLMRGELKAVTLARYFCGVTGGVILPLIVSWSDAQPALALAIMPFCVLGELCERYLFFTAVVPPKMPGGLAA